MWHCQSQRKGSVGGGVSSTLALGRSVDVAFLDGGDAGGVIGSFGENGEGGMARPEDLKGTGLIVRWPGMTADVF